ncbi:MAG: cache domain-containing protein [Sulfurospirillaceae bacterium]|nr:cache domain-containing protein [Sulfurospirillaceae bacterium]MDD2826190.1 cache domain-containing protein [Sulfurospirillaceae bacterium]
MKKKSSLFSYFHIASLVLFLSFATLFLLSSFFDIQSRFHQRTSELKAEHIQAKKKMLENEVDRFVDFINIKRKHIYSQTQAITKERVLEAYTLATQLYTKYHGIKSDDEIAEMIKESLRTIRFENGQGYYFITRLDGIEVLFSDKPTMEGVNMLSVKNSEGRNVVKGMIDVVTSIKEGYYEYMWSKPNQKDKEFKKISYVKLFEPYHWFIGTGLYLDDREMKIKEDIVNDEERTLFDKQNKNYIFVGTWDGVSLTYPTKNKNMINIQDKNGKFIVQELIDKAQSGGGYVDYVMPALKNERNMQKLSYVIGIPEWQWYVGAGVYVDDIDEEIAHLQVKMKQSFQRSVLFMIALMVVFGILLGFLYSKISDKIKKDFFTFANFFDDLSHRDNFIDITKLKFREFEEMASHANIMLETKLSMTKNLEKYKKIVSSSDDLLALIDKNYTYLAISGGYIKFFNKSQEEILGHTMPELLGEEYFNKNIKSYSDRVLCGESFEAEYWIETSQCRHFLHSKYHPFFEDGIEKAASAYVVSARDITDKKEYEDKLVASERELEFLAHNDALTGLPNRVFLNGRISHALKNANRLGTLIAVCFIDLDNFKRINDSFGHSYGDDILKQLSRRFEVSIRSSDTLSRIGGDEFILLLENINTEHEITTIIAKIQSVFNTPFLSKGETFFLTSSIGVSVYPDHGLDSETLIKNADAAMYKAKEAGKNTYAFYTLDMTIASYERIGIENALRVAIEQSQFIVYYQPQINLQSQKVVGLEALIRWNHPRDGIITPGRFIQFAEDARLIIPIGEFVLRRGCLDLISLKKEHILTEETTLSVNISGIQIEYSDFLSTLKMILAETKINPSSLEMEITESFIMNDPARWIELLHSMRNLGVSIAIDDFGTGYSSLSYLRKLPIDKLKVDMSFVKDIPEHEDACAIVDSILNLAHTMKITSLAEGIERIEQEHYLASHHCKQGQGFMYAKPMDVKSLKEWLKLRA